MSKPSLERRLSKLEQQMATLIAVPRATSRAVKSSNSRRQQPLVARDRWKQTLGKFGSEDGMEEVFQAAMRLREGDRRQAKSPASKPSTAKRTRRRKPVEVPHFVSVRGS
jgi:hypothetical protein